MSTIPRKPKNLHSEIVDSVLRILREQRDDKNMIEAHGHYEINPQLFNSTNHFITKKIEFTSPFLAKPVITFGQHGQEAQENVTTLGQTGTGYTPVVLHPYVYKFAHDGGVFSGFYIGLYLITAVPQSVSKHMIGWIAKGKGTHYPGQKVDEAWTSSYNRNYAHYLVNETGGADEQ